jgi:hypothetical protein
VKRTGYWLRRIADRVDREHAALCSSLTLRFVEHEGALVEFGGDGCPLWYFADDYDLAFTGEGGGIPTGRTERELREQIKYMAEIICEVHE